MPKFFMRRLSKSKGKLVVLLFMVLPLIFSNQVYAFISIGANPSQSFNLNEGLAGTSQKWSFVQLTDLHIGEGYDDYGTPGYDDAPQGEEGTSAQNLREAVNWINQNAASKQIRFVMVTGDITDSAEKSEFMKAKEILDLLQIPYIPMLGNHDVWPYTKTAEAPKPNGDAYFKDLFSTQFEYLKSVMPNWDDGTRLTLIHNGENDCDSYFQNFAFDYGGYHFICTDFNTRAHAISGSGANPSADLYDSEQCRGTWYWYKSHIRDCNFKATKNILNFTHQPLCTTPDQIFTFSNAEYETVTNFIYENAEYGSHHYYQGLWIGGHFHQVIPDFSPEFEYEIKTTSGQYICPGIHTMAVKDDPSRFRIINVWDKTDFPNPDGVLLYEDENFKGKGEFFTTEEEDLSDNPIGSGSASSLRIRGSGTAELFDEVKYSGNVLETNSSTVSLNSLNFDNKAKSVRFDFPGIESINPDSAETSKSVKVVIEGKRFREYLSVWLNKKGSSKFFYGKMTQFESSNRISTTFDLTNAETGVYDLYVCNLNGCRNYLENCFTVTEGPPPPPPVPTEPSKTWYLAEGSTSGFETFILVQNPNQTEAKVTLRFQTPSGEVKGPENVVLPKMSRQTFNVGDYVKNEYSVSTVVEADVAVIAERAMYWEGRIAGHDSTGVTSASKTWYLAEGSTAGGFETWILVQNPNSEDAKVSIYYQTPSGEVEGPKLTLKGKTRQSISISNTLPDTWDVSTRVTSDKPIIAERSVYWNGRRGGHESIGTTSPSSVWYLAEGSTKGFETWVLVQNPNSEDAKVTLTFMTDKGEVKGPEVTVKKNSRLSVNVGNICPDTSDISTKVTSDKPVIAERAMYLGGRIEGHDSVGVISPAKTWYLAEGSTAGGFETWVLVQNPNSEDATVTLTLMTPEGEKEGPKVEVPRNSRRSINLGDILPNTWSVSTKVEGTLGIIVERAMYWNGRTAGHESCGVPM